MVVRPKTEKIEMSDEELEKERMRIIRQAAPIAEQNTAPKKEWYNFTLRIKYEMLEEIDEALKEMAGLSKTGFILQAIQEKLKRQNAMD